MKILRLTVEEHRGDLRQAVGAANCRTEERSGLLVRVHDDTGRVGLGEASPLPGYSRDTLAECRAQLGRFSLGGFDADGPLLPQLRALPHTAPAARFAVETALLDLVAQRRERPLGALLGELRPSLPLSVVCERLETALAARERGVTAFKIKVGRAGLFERERDLVMSLRRALGDEVELRVDANQAFAADEAAARLQALVPARPRFVEEPLAGGLLAAPRDWPLPVAADETLQRPGALAALEPALADGRVQALVLKPMALGGFTACLEFAARAERHGCAVVVTHLWDGPVALAAAAQLALALPGTLLACGLAAHPGLDAWPALPLPFLQPATLRAPERPGLGVAW